MPQIDVPLGDVPDYQPRETLKNGEDYFVDVESAEIKDPKPKTPPTPGTVTHVAFVVTEGTTTEGRVLSSDAPFKLMDFFATGFDFARSKMVRWLKSLGYTQEQIASGVDTEDTVGKRAKATIKNVPGTDEDGKAIERSQIKDYVYDK